MRAKIVYIFDVVVAILATLILVYRGIIDATKVTLVLPFNQLAHADKIRVVIISIEFGAAMLLIWLFFKYILPDRKRVFKK